MGVYLIDFTDTANRKSGKAVEEADTHMKVRKGRATFLGGGRASREDEAFCWGRRGRGLCDCGPRPARRGNSRSKGVVREKRGLQTTE